MLFGEVLVRELRSKRKLGVKTKQIVGKIIASKLLKKYGLIGFAGHIIGYRELKNAMRCTGVAYEKNWKKNAFSTESKMVQRFLEDDLNSRMLPGKKDGKKVVQRRLLLNSLKDLHQKYRTEFNSTISYTTFLRLKPAWIVQPKLSDRETCACMKHGNIQFVVCKLNRIGVLKERNAEEICNLFCCEVTNKKCMFRECMVCTDKNIFTDLSLTDADLDNEIAYFQWNRKTEKRLIKGKEKVITSTQKAVLTCSLRGLLKRFQHKSCCLHEACFQYTTSA